MTISAKKQIVPAILEKNYSAIEKKVLRITNLTNWVQVDVCDGRFVPSKTYASAGRTDSVKRISSLVKKNKIKLELDMMVDLDYANRMDRWINAISIVKPDRVIWHLGSTHRFEELFRGLDRAFARTKQPQYYLAVRPSHTLPMIHKMLDQHEFVGVQVMGIEKIGYSGQKLSDKSIALIKKIRAKYPRLPIAVDGGVKTGNAKRLFDAGATALGANSGLFKADDVKARIKEFTI